MRGKGLTTLAANEYERAVNIRIPAGVPIVESIDGGEYRPTTVETLQTLKEGAVVTIRKVEEVVLEVQIGIANTILTDCRSECPCTLPLKHRGDRIVAMKFLFPSSAHCCSTSRPSRASPWSLTPAPRRAASGRMRKRGKATPTQGGRLCPDSRGTCRHLRRPLRRCTANGPCRGDAVVLAREIDADGRRTDQDRTGRHHDGRWL